MGLVRVEVYPNEMIARLCASILRDEGIESIVNPERGGYGMWGHDSFIAHALWVLDSDVERAKVCLQESQPDTPE